MDWIADPTPGEWLRDRLDDVWLDMHSAVPRGFQAYARVFHRPQVRWLPDRPFPANEEWERLTEVEHLSLVGSFQEAQTTWAETAAAFGTTMHPLAQWQRIVRTPAGEDWNTRIGPDGREYTAPEDGQLDPERFAALAEHLLAHTRTPDDGVAALWEGWGDLVGSVRSPGSTAVFASGDDARHQAMLQQSIHDPFNNVFRKPTWHSGILSDEISQGPRLELPGREYVLFGGSLRAFADSTWVREVPWSDTHQNPTWSFAAEDADPAAEGRTEWITAQHPNLVWPGDRAWVMVSEIDFDSTVVAGSADLIRAICADPRLEALPIVEGSDLSWEADDLNRGS
ncbi:MAG: hypothetical protein ACQEW8_13155 [Actinomycetota bacterium]